MVIKNSSHAKKTTKYIIKLRYVVALIIFAGLLLGKLHGSSLAIWDLYLKEKTDNYEKTLIFGKPRAIRTDEYLVQTPMYLGQCTTKDFFPVINKNIRSDGQNMLLYVYAPVFNITIIGKPFNWGFLLLGKEYGLSWYWYSKLILLILMSFEICMFLTNRNILISSIGAFIIAFSPGIQWWFSTGITDLLIYSQAIPILTYYYFQNNSILKKFLLLICLSISIIGYLLTIYPPIQIPLGIIILIIVGYIFFINFKNIKLKIYDYIFVLFFLFLIALVVYTFLKETKEALIITRNTVYPGKRFSRGGNYNIGYLQIYLVNWLFPFKSVNISNNCELSTFPNLLPTVILLSPKILKISKNKVLFVILLIYTFFQISWLVVKYPLLFAKISLFSYVTEGRLSLIINLIGLYLTFITLSELGNIKKLPHYFIFIILSFLFMVYFLSIKNTMMYEYINSWKIIIIILIYFLILNYVFLANKRKIFLTLFSMYILISGITVNPISRGIDSIYEKQVSKRLIEISEKYEGEKWAAVNSLHYDNLLVALGIKTFNSVHTYPDLNMWKKLDPEGKYQNIYNRYAHVELQLTDNETYFELKFPDHFCIYLNYLDIYKTGIRFILSNISLDKYNNLDIYEKFDKDNLYLYKVKDVF